MVEFSSDEFRAVAAAAGARVVAGVDEVGRGAWAGPLCVGVVCVAVDAVLPSGLADSKLLSATHLAAAAESLDRAESAGVLWSAVGSAQASEIDLWGVSGALRVAARRAFVEVFAAGCCEPDVVCLDGPHDYLSGTVPFDAMELVAVADCLDVRPVVGGDRRVDVVAAASIVAKRHRDQVMSRLAAFDGDPYGFASNVGYPTAAHRAAVDRLGLGTQHRRSWSVS